MKSKSLLLTLVVLIATPSLFATTHTWTGASSANWSDVNNWSPATVPSAGDAFMFPAGAQRLVMTNDLVAGTSVGAVTFNDSYTLNGNALVLMGNWTFDPSKVFICRVDLKIGAPLTLGNALTTDFYGALDVNGQMLAIGSYITFHGPVNGSGTINFQYDATSFLAGGTFSGTINGYANIVGSMPGANIVGGLSGDATVGNVTIQGSDLDWEPFEPGNTNPCCVNSHTIGTLNTKSFSTTGRTFFDINANSPSDAVHVTGTVSVGGDIFIDLRSGAPAAGQTFVLIDNDGTDQVSGFYHFLPEGSTMSLGGATLQISYHGGDGNDVVLKAVSSAKTWTGAVNGNWSNTGNWSPASVPSAGEAVVFPAGGQNRAMTNDLGNGFNVGKMTFNDSYTLSGNSLLLTGDWTFDQIKTFTCNVDLKIGAPLTLGRAITSEFYGTLDVNGQTLAIEPYNTTFHGPVNGSGTINVISDGVSFLAAGNFSGTLNGWVNVIGSMPNMNVIGGLSGDATVGNVTVQGDDLFWRPLIVGNTNPCCIDGHVIGTLNTKSFATTGRAWFDVSASGPSDVVHVNGNVSLGGDFILSLIGGAVPLGQTVTLIDNDGTDPVVGAFHFLPEGSLVLGSAPLFRISYHGGDGNDVTVTRVETSTTTISQSVASSKSGELFSLTANVLGGPAAGDVTFYDGATPLATVTLVSGTATLNTSLAQGTHSLTVRYAGSQMLTSSASPAIDHMVERGDSQTTLTASRTSSAYGDPITFSFGVNAVAPAIGTPAGSVALKRSSTQVGSSSLANGGGTLTLATLDAGHHVLTASFAGDANFSASSSSEVTVDIAKRATRTDARASRETIASGSHALIEVTISASHSAIPVTGVVQISEDGHTLAQSAISQSSATLDAGVFSTGDHTLVVSYLGATNFEASSTMVTLHVTLPSLSITDTSVVEGNSASKTYVVYARLSAPSSETVLVSYATEPGTAKEGEDFSAAQGTLTFAPGETTNAINLTIFGDTTAEDDETFTVTLSQPSKATLESSMAQITIVNDDIGYRASLGNVYATVALSSLTMDVYTPIEAKGGLPAVVWIPSINLYEPDSGATPPLRETNRGYVVVAANYRGASVAPFPAQLDDLKAAIRWLRANAARFNINPDRIAVWGHGTGAHLASLLGTTGDSVSAESLKEGNPSFSNQVQSVVDWAGVTDVAHLESDSPASCNANFIAQSQLGGSPSAESPLTFVNNGDAPFLIMHGAADCSVPLAQSQRFYDALRASNVPAILQVINGATPFDAYWFSAAAYGEVDAFLDANLKKAAKRRAAR